MSDMTYVYVLKEILRIIEIWDYSNRLQAMFCVQTNKSRPWNNNTIINLSVYIFILTSDIRQHILTGSIVGNSKFYIDINKYQY